eukprot:364353-Chlamydomonas_euryale.AAC.5
MLWMGWLWLGFGCLLASCSCLWLAHVRPLLNASQQGWPFAGGHAHACVHACMNAQTQRCARQE